MTNKTTRRSPNTIANQAKKAAHAAANTAYLAAQAAHAAATAEEAQQHADAANLAADLAIAAAKEARHAAQNTRACDDSFKAIDAAESAEMLAQSAQSEAAKAAQAAAHLGAKPLTLTQSWTLRSLDADLFCEYANLFIAKVHNIRLGEDGRTLERHTISADEAAALAIVESRVDAYLGHADAAGDYSDYNLRNYVQMAKENLNADSGVSIFSTYRGQVDTSAATEAYFERIAIMAANTAAAHCEAAIDARTERSHNQRDQALAQAATKRAIAAADLATQAAQRAERAALGFVYNTPVNRHAIAARADADLALYHANIAKEAQRLDDIDHARHARRAAQEAAQAAPDLVEIDIDYLFTLTPENAAKIAAAKVAEDNAAARRAALPKIEIVAFAATVAPLGWDLIEPTPEEAPAPTMEAIAAHLSYTHGITANFAAGDYSAPLAAVVDQPRRLGADEALTLAFDDAQIAHQAANLAADLWRIHPISHYQRAHTARHCATSAAQRVYNLAVAAYLGLDACNYAQLRNEAAAEKDRALAELSECIRIQREHTAAIIAAQEAATNFLAKPYTHP